MRRRARGQGSTEIMLIISVITATVVAAAATMIPLFQSGVEDLGQDVKGILSTGSVGGGTSSGTSADDGGSGSSSATPADYQNAADTQGNDPVDIGSPFLG